MALPTKLQRIQARCESLKNEGLSAEAAFDKLRKESISPVHAMAVTSEVYSKDANEMKKHFFSGLSEEEKRRTNELHDKLEEKL